MKSTLRQGFTLVELLFVMAIIAILAGFAIANLKDSSKTATVNSLKNDARNAIAVEQTYFAENQAYDTATCDPTNVVNGKCTGDDASGTGTPISLSVSKGNSLTVTNVDCGDGTLGFSLLVSNDQYTDIISYDSCNDGTIKHVDSLLPISGDVPPA